MEIEKDDDEEVRERYFKIMILEIIDQTSELSFLIDQNADLEVIASGHLFTEGPVWDERNDRLLFSDIPANTIYQWNRETGKSIYRRPSHFANGLVFDNNGNLIICEHQRRVISKDDGSQEVTILAEKFAEFRLNSPNDVIVAADNSILFTDPIYGLRPGNGGPAIQELPFQGVYRLTPKNFDLFLITDTLERPNGLAISPIDQKLFVADTVKQHIRVFDFDMNWNFTDAGIWAELWDAGFEGRPDGMKFDHLGNLFTTGPGGIWIFNNAGNLLGRIIIPNKTSNLAWGDDDRKSLFITASDKVYRLRCITHGIL